LINSNHMITHKTLKPYRLLTWLFVASLLLNVQSAFACTMMPDMPDMPEPTHECCLARHGGELSEAPDSARSVSDTCFTLKISLQIKASPEADADPGNDHALVKDKKEAQDQTLAMALIILTVLRAPRDNRSVVPSSDEPFRAHFPVYQATQRYRI